MSSNRFSKISRTNTPSFWVALLCELRRDLPGEIRVVVDAKSRALAHPTFEKEHGEHPARVTSVRCAHAFGRYANSQRIVPTIVNDSPIVRRWKLTSVELRPGAIVR